jgi:predicted lipid-binding transport protein (Tim44 family)
MPENSLTNPVPQFATAEYAGKSGDDRCRTCNQPVVGNYYRINGALACSSCAQKAEQSLPKDSHQVFVRGVTFGVGGAILGLILYSAVGIITGLMIGYISLAVGYIIGKAIMMGSKGIGGQRYQIAAAVLTYAAVSLSAVPIGISQIVKMKQHNPPARAEQLQSRPGQLNEVAPGDSVSAQQRAQQPAKSRPKFGSAVGALALAGLASPFLGFNQDPIRGWLGLIILFVGIRIAWKLTEGRAETGVIGPFEV